MTNQISDNNKRIAKNTLLYFRMLFMMVVSLYTSRVILNALGVEYFGIYNVVGGVVVIQLLLSLIMVVLQFSIVTFVIGLISAPYNIKFCQLYLNKDYDI